MSEAAVLAEQSGKTMRKVRALVFPMKQEATEPGKDVPVSRATAWEPLLTAGMVIEPPFDVFALASMPGNNSELGQCIEAMEVNIVGYGWRLVPLDGEVDPDDSSESSAEVKEEYDRFSEYLNYGSYDDNSFTAVRRAQRKDLESTGMCYLEAITIPSTGEITGYRHIPSYQMRLGKLDEVATEYEQVRIVGSGNNRQIKTVKKFKRFRRYVQLYQYGSEYKQVWFKELLDPRQIRSDTGEVVKEGEKVSSSQLANPMMFRRIYACHTPYGVPRYIGNLLAILGGRASEEINFTTFKNNNVPSMMLMVSNGQLTDGTISRIKTFVESNIQGSDNYSKFLIIEAEPDNTDGGQVRIDVKEMVNSQQTDAMFQEYDKNNADKVRRSFRLPPIFVGKTEDYTRATAEASRRLGDEQVFAPERDEEDHDWNGLLRQMGMKNHQFKTNTPNVTDDQDLLSLLAAAEKVGAMTPRIGRRFVEDILGRRIPKADASVKLDIPFSLQMAEAVKNMAQPNEPGQQITAMKMVDGLSDLRATLVGEVLRKERLLSSGAMPAVVLAPRDALRVASGSLNRLRGLDKADVSERQFALSDGTHVLAFLSLSPLAENDEGCSYFVDSVLPVEPALHMPLEDQDDVPCFHDALRVW